MRERTLACAVRLAIACAATLGDAMALEDLDPHGLVELSASPWRVAPHTPVDITVSYSWSSPWHAVAEPSPADEFAQQEVLAMSPAERAASGGVERRVVRMRVMPPGTGRWALPRLALTLVGPDGEETILHSAAVEVLVTDAPRVGLPIAELVLPLAQSHAARWWLLAAGAACAAVLAAWALLRAARHARVVPLSPDERFGALVERTRSTPDARAAAAMLALAVRQRAGDACGFDGATATTAEASAQAARVLTPSAAAQLGSLLAGLDGLRFAPADMAPRSMDEMRARAVAWRSSLAATAAASQARP